MASCEKCWGDAYFRMISNPMKCQSEHYQDLIKERKNNQCTFEEQAGNGLICSNCKRKTIHQYTKSCLICGKKFIIIK